MKKIFLSLLITVVFFLYPQLTVAQTQYVLPYPSFMPGSTLYTFHLAWEKIGKFWYFGNFSQFVYNLKLADKYLVEAKTLFEYKQYLLAHKALKKSDGYFVVAYRYLGKAKQEGKNISQKEETLKEASLKHVEILEQIKKNVPEQFVWTPEKDKQTQLFLWKQIGEAIEVRKSCI